MPTRFKYTNVQPKAFGLTAMEILSATDAELNQYISVKKYAPYRRKEGRWDQTHADKLWELRRILQERGVVPDNPEGGDDERPAKKRKGKRERMKTKEAAAVNTLNDSIEQNLDGQQASSSSKRIGDEGDRDERPGRRKRKRRVKSANHDPLQ
jgi:protein KRI1